MGAGRPKKEIQAESFEKLCAILCTEEEIADFFDCSISTLSRFCKRTYGANFAEVYKKYSVRGKISLRRYQFKIAETNAGMAIFLGKNYLGQKDVMPEENDEAVALLKDILAQNRENAKYIYSDAKTE
ncbi:MAG: hypothetical protein J6X83_00845 [Methanomicrobium sp.]|nr:hypothetical protein [Methanomicrobium sp.]